MSFCVVGGIFGSKILVESTAALLINNKIKTHYVLIPEGQVIFSSSERTGLNWGEGKFTNTEKSPIFESLLQAWKDAGFIVYNYTYPVSKSGKLMRNVKINGAEISINEDTKKYPHVILYNKHDLPVTYGNSESSSIYAFIGGERKVDKIVSIVKGGDLYNVKFTFTLIPNNFTSKMNINKKRFKGETLIKYDIYSDKYIVTSIRYSSLEGPSKDEWFDLAWGDEVNGKPIARVGGQ